uniref:AT-hook motif nuclear-localized protein n=1 Tax=Kalanchoe fedtschenkoi TaxID=63787 RepID=A0A7N0UR61_KALFE
MEGKEGGVIVVSSDAPSDYKVARRPLPEVNGQVGMSPAPATEGLAVKKKRGRPRKYMPGETPPSAVISPKPISSATPLPSVIDFSAAKRAKVRPDSKLQSRVHLGSSNFGDFVACSMGGNFTPHIISVNTGEDITKKIISFSQQGPRAICILSASGAISSVTLRQPDSSGGTLTYEGRFEILSLSGSFMPSEASGTRSRVGGMSVSLASPDGRVMGGGVAGLLIAANPVQVAPPPPHALYTKVDISSVTPL